MKIVIFLVVVVCFFKLISIQVSAKQDWPQIKGDYLGQEPPGMTPELFAPEVISSSESFELNAVFSPNGRIFMFSRRIDGIYKMFFSFKGQDQVWSEPRIAGPSKTYPGHRDVDMAFSPDSKWLYFISDRPLQGYSLDRYNIWRSRFDRFGLGTPEPLPAHINGPDNELYPVIVNNGSLYFSSTREDSLGRRDSYVAIYQDGEFSKPINLGMNINSEHAEGDIYVSPDEQILIHVSTNREGGFGDGDLYISFKQEDGSWSKSKNMGTTFNTPELDYCPMISPDGKYFFFSRGGDIYWVSSEALYLIANEQIQR